MIYAGAFRSTGVRHMPAHIIKHGEEYGYFNRSTEGIQRQAF